VGQRSTVAWNVDRQREGETTRSVAVHSASGTQEGRWQSVAVSKWRMLLSHSVQQAEQKGRIVAHLLDVPLWHRALRLGEKGAISRGKRSRCTIRLTTAGSLRMAVCTTSRALFIDTLQERRQSCGTLARTQRQTSTSTRAGPRRCGRRSSWGSSRARMVPHAAFADCVPHRQSRSQLFS